MRKILVGLFLVLFLAGVAWAQPVDLERTLPELVGQSNEEVERVLGRPDTWFQWPRSLTYTYWRWRRHHVEVYFEARGDKWIVTGFKNNRYR